MSPNRVVHIGPIASTGGMSSVMKILIQNSPDGWESGSISTHSDVSFIRKIKLWRSSRGELKQMIQRNEIDIAHIHVTHSLSWVRKVGFIKKCRKHNIPIVIHIHSGRFDDFCNRYFGLLGIYVKRSLAHPDTKVVLLEKRWKKLLKKWIPDDSEVINNSANKIYKKREYSEVAPLKILMMARNDKIKGHLFAISIVKYLISEGVDVKMNITGITTPKKNVNKSIEFKGWVSNNYRDKLIAESDFLLLPSKFEGSSMAIIESVVNGLPCLVSSSSSETIGIKELSLPLINPKDWGDKIIDLMKIDEYKRICIKINQESIRFDPVKNKHKWRELYRTLITNE